MTEPLHASARNADADVLILGGGVVGLACAHYLLAAGRTVEVLEQAVIGAGASHGNCGTLTPSHAPPLPMPGMIGKALRMMLEADAPFHIKPSFDPALLSWMLHFAACCNWRDFRTAIPSRAALLTRSRELIEELVRGECLDCGFQNAGTLSVYREARSLEQVSAQLERLRELGIPSEVLDRASARRLEPALNERIAGAIHYPRDAHLRPDRFVAELGRSVRARGATIREGERVIGFDTEGRRVASVITSSGARPAREIVLALGAWSPAMGGELGVKIPVQPGKGYSITYDRPAICPSLPLTLKERSVCVTAWSGGYRLGSTMEFAGYDTSLNRRQLDALVRGATEYLIEPEGPRRIEEWYGWRPMTWDDQPIIGRAPGFDNLTLATGHGMLGLTLSAITGVLVSEIVCAQPPSMDLAPFRPSRFSRTRS